MRLSKLEKAYVNSEWQAGKNIKIAERLFREIDSSRVTKVLEVGCGIGMLASYLANKHKWNVTGIDLDPEQIALAKNQRTERGHLAFFEADVTTLPFEKGEFDMVLSFDVLHHIPCWGKAVEEIGRVLKAGGFYVFNDLAFSGLTARIFRGLLRNYMAVYVLDDVIDCLRKNDFEIVHEKKPALTVMGHFDVVSRRTRL